MQIFEEKDNIEVKVKCKICLEEIKFNVTEDEYKNAPKFPICRESIHGVPKHNLIVYLNRNLEIDNFEVKDILDTEVSYSEELTRQVLSEIELSEEEIRLFFLTTGRDAVSLGEIALLLDKTKEESREIARKFVNKGLYKEIIGATPHFTALPPYAALVSQLKKFHSYISTIEEEIPPRLSKSFSEIESQAEGVKDLRSYTNFMLDLKENVLSKIQSQEDTIKSTITGIEKIRNLSKIISKLDSKATKLMEDQIKDIKEQFDKVNSKITNSMNKQVKNLTTQFETMNDNIADIIITQLEELPSQLDNVMARISDNLKKLHLGVVQKTVEKVFNNVFKGWLKDMTQSFSEQLSEIKEISSNGLNQTVKSLNNQITEIEKVSTEALESTANNFNTRLIGKLKESIESTLNEINQITSSTSKSAEDIKQIFGSIGEDFGNAVSLAGDKISGISDNILKSFRNLQETFSSQVLHTLEDVLTKIMERLEISEITTTEFWEQAKKVSLFTMKDIWFIRSIESAKAYVREELNNAKMRVLIIAPEISDIDVFAIKHSRKHLNIRIAAYIDVRNSDHARILHKLDQLSNVTYRHRELKNMWGMSRDYEQIILCVVSTTEVKDKVITEIAGIGSIIPEHIKIFTPILEDAWIGARKKIESYEVGERVEVSQPKEEQILARELKHEKREPIEVQPSIETIPKELEPTSVVQKSTEDIEPELLTGQNSEKVKLIKAASKSKSLESPISKPAKEKIDEESSAKPSTPLKEGSLSVSDILKTRKLMSKKEEKPTSTKPVSAAKEVKPSKPLPTKEISSGADIANFMNDLKQELPGITAQILSEKLKNLAESIEMVLGYSRVLDPIKKTSTEMSVKSGLLNDRDRNLLLKRIDFWKKKLNL